MTDLEIERQMEESMAMWYTDAMQDTEWGPPLGSLLPPHTTTVMCSPQICWRGASCPNKVTCVYDHPIPPQKKKNSFYGPRRTPQPPPPVVPQSIYTLWSKDPTDPRVLYWMDVMAQEYKDTLRGTAGQRSVRPSSEAARM